MHVEIKQRDDLIEQRDINRPGRFDKLNWILNILFKKKYILCVKDDSSGYHPERVISFSSSRSVSFSQMPNSAARKTKERREEIEVASKSRIIKGGFRQWRRRVGERAQLEKRRRRRSGRGGLLQERGRSGGGRRRKIRIGYKFYCFYSPPFASRPC